MNDASVDIELTKVADRTTTAASDVVAAEEPLEIRLEGSSFVVIMRTPGADRELTAGRGGCGPGGDGAGGPAPGHREQLVWRLRPQDDR